MFARFVKQGKTVTGHPERGKTGDALAFKFRMIAAQRTDNCLGQTSQNPAMGMPCRTPEVRG
jgi:hypothetical protein